MFGTRQKIQNLREDMVLLRKEMIALQDLFLTFRSRVYKIGGKHTEDRKPPPDDEEDLDELLSKMTPDQQQFVATLPEYKKYREDKHFKTQGASE